MVSGRVAPSLAQRALSFPNSRGERLAGVLHGPVQPQMVLCCHGMFSHKDGAKHVMLAGMLHKLGLSTLRFDFAGAGQSEGRLFDLSCSRRMEDLDAALNFLAEAGALRLGVFGSSLGGAVALLAAARDERIAAVATLAAVAYPQALIEDQDGMASAWQERGYHDFPAGRVGVEFLADARAHDVVAATAVLRAPVLVVHGDQDNVVPCSHAHDLATAARNSSLELVLGADHHFSQDVHLRPTMQQIANFFATTLLGSRS